MKDHMIVRSEDLCRTNDAALQLNRHERNIAFGSLEVATADCVVLLNAKHQTQIEAIVAEGLDVFYGPDEVSEPTLAQATIGRPTIIARVDCTIDKTGNVQPFEVEERPAGMGVIHELNRLVGGSCVKSQILHHCERVLGQTPVVGISHQRLYGTDDSLVLESMPIDALPSEGAVLLRADPNEFRGSFRDGLIHRSITTVRSKGRKDYRIRTGYAKPIRRLDELDETTSCVVKPLQGSKTRGVMVYLTAADRERYGKHGCVSFNRLRSGIGSALHNGEAVISEELRPPIRVKMPDGKLGNMILRILTLVDKSTVRCVGGAFVARRELIVHGASNALSGAILMEESRP